MELQKHFVAYIDILGFSKYIKDNLQTPEKPLELLQQFIGIFKELQLSDKLDIFAFSDNIVVSMLAEEQSPQSDHLEIWKFIYYINALQIYVISMIGILPIRGGISYGDFYHNGSEILFGDAMIQAYDYERLHAFFPRIVVIPKFLDPNNYMTAHKNLAAMGLPIKLPEYNPEQLKRQYPVAYDYDSMLYCNYLSALFSKGKRVNYSDDALNKHKIFIVSNLQQEDMSVLRKYAWMKSYHNWFCRPFAEFQKFIIQDCK